MLLTDRSVDGTAAAGESARIEEVLHHRPWVRNLNAHDGECAKRRCMVCREAIIQGQDDLWPRASEPSEGPFHEWFCVFLDAGTVRDDQLVEDPTKATSRAIAAPGFDS